MNDYVLSALLGIVEGLTEFLPVSSTAHLRISEALFDVSLTDGYWKTYTVVIQLGAILCLPVYFRSRIVEFLSVWPSDGRSRRSLLTHPIALVMVAFVCTALPAFLLTRLIGKNLESLVIMGTALVVGGVVMWLVDSRSAPWEAAGPDAPQSLVTTWKIENMKVSQAVWIGLCQVLSALFPGTSRSMATIAAGQVTGMSRTAALEFSFFLSMPTMAAATGYDLLKAATARGEANVLGASGIDGRGWILLAIGFVFSFLVAYSAVAWFMSWVRRRGFVPFAVYRIILGTAVLLWAARSR